MSSAHEFVVSSKRKSVGPSADVSICEHHLDPVYPIAGSHAVQSAGFAIEWTTPLTDQELRQVEALKDQLSGSLPHLGRTHALSIALNNNRPITSQSPGSVIFSRPSMGAPNAFSRQLEVSKERCVGQFNEYTRWADVWSEVFGWFEHVIPLFAAAHPVKAFGLQYTDVFHWRADKKTFDVTKILRRGSPYLPDHVFDVDLLWHSHHGFLTDGTTPMAHRLLENVNVNVLEDLGQRSVVISMVHRAEFAPIWVWDQVKSSLSALMPELHQRNKDLLSSVLNDETCKKINLNGQVAAK